MLFLQCLNIVTEQFILRLHEPAQVICQDCHFFDNHHMLLCFLNNHITAPFRWQYTEFEPKFTIFAVILLIMPTISEFFGIFIYIRFLDHNPPHFHAKYGDQEVTIDIVNGTIRGEMYERALRLILEWLDLHRAEILEAWHKAANGEQPGKIEPLK